MKTRFTTVLGTAALLLALSEGALAADVKVKLSGDQETPAVTTKASGTATVTVGDDKSISGKVKAKELTETTAGHIHVGAPGEKGPPVVHLTKVSDNEWTIPAGTVLSDADYANFKAGKLYVNIHTAANKGGEIRGQITP